ncbi:MAG: MG2 domain-containing protein [Maribacter sp.]
MRYFIALLPIILFSQMIQSQNNNNSYDFLWDEVNNFEEDDLTKSALEVVKKITDKAKKEDNPIQNIKALLYSSKFLMTLEEDAQLKIVNKFKEEIKKAESPTKNILESYLANLYWQYFQQNRYRFYNRTTTESKVDTSDFRTWDLNTLFIEIDAQFEASLDDRELLKKTPVAEIEELLVKIKGSEDYRPTLFDLLAQDALDFYTTDENTINRPADKFEIINPEFLGDSRQFVKLDISMANQSSLQANALCLFQDLMLFHLDSSKPYLFAQLDIQRLQFVHQKAVFENKDHVYLESLRAYVSKNSDSPGKTLYQYELASFLNQLGENYSLENGEEHRWQIKEALEICEKVIQSSPDTRGAGKCKALKSSILSSQLEIRAERHIPSNQTSRMLVTYKNYNALKFNAYTVTQEKLEILEGLYDEKKKFDFITKLPLVTTWESSIKNEGDYQNHSTEVSIPPMKNGQYLILATPRKEGDQTFTYSPLQVTNMALVEIPMEKAYKFQVIDRVTGKPIPKAKIRYEFETDYNGKTSLKSYVTDANGMFSVEKTKQSQNRIRITINQENDTANYSDYYISPSYNNRDTQDNYTCFLFTERSIYRPGQPLYFKGIAIKKDASSTYLLKKEWVKVILKDVNGQTIKTLKFKTNEFGSFSGEFILPNNGLTGLFSMEATSDSFNLNGYTSFSVEEYKRPKFETSFKPVKESFQVNDTITVTGTATAYVGSNITDAKVTYRVKRVVSYPRWYYWSRPFTNTAPQEITHGETTTDASGKYSINFKAIPDTTIDKKNLPTFRYEVTADVTDINGETYSATTIVSVGYHTLTARISMDSPLNKDEKNHKLSITTNNLNGQPVPAEVTVKIYKLQAPENVLRPREWSAPDYSGYTKDEFKELFPHIPFSNEQQVQNWKKGDQVWESSFDTGITTEISLGSIQKWTSGEYLIELETKDAFGQEVKDVLNISVFSPTDKTLADHQLFRIKTDKKSYGPNEKAKITVLSNAKNLYVTLYIEKDQKVIETKVLHLKENSESFTIPINQNDLGGFAISYTYAAYNYFETGSLNISVPYPNTDLEIETITFRDKLEPGTDETWSFKIIGPKGDKVAAELLASMYDASLDSFRSHSWNFNPVSKPIYYSILRPNAYTAFTTTYFSTYKKNDTYYYSGQGFDFFEWFGLNFGNRGLFFESRAGNTRKGASVAGIQMEYAEADLEESVMGSAAPSFRKGKDDELIGINPEESHNESNTIDETAAVSIRKNLQETAFFFPQLQTDEEGNVSFTFTTPEALTKWNLQLLAHTQNLESAYKTLTTVTQKELMVVPNVPRFLRQGDEIVISTKISNLTDNSLSGTASLTLTDAVTGSNISKHLLSDSENNDFTVDSLGNTQVSWRLKIPKGLQAVQYTIVAKAGSFSDGEQNLLPVLSNRMLITETLPMWVRGNETKTFTLDKLKNTQLGTERSGNTLKNHQLTLEMTSNPAWYAVQALPYLMEYPYECSEQLFSKYYANALASHMANSNPRIKEVFTQWANADAVLSNLEKNEELKSLLIQETPWLRDAQSETEQKKRIGLLFDLNKMKNDESSALHKLSQNQKSSGAWPWFNGGPDNRYITQYIIAGLGHLKSLSVTSSEVDMQSVMEKAMSYLDDEFVKEYEDMKKQASDINDDHLSAMQVHYLYMRSFFPDIKPSKKVQEIMSYYQGQTVKYWKKRGLYAKGMLALSANRWGDIKTSAKIIKALEENSVNSEELGMYWKENKSSWYWYQAPIETQALLIEAFSEIQPADIKTIDNLKIWLLKQKQTNQWSTTKATSEAIYALLLNGSDWLSITDAVEVIVGGEKIIPGQLENAKAEAGTGYFKTSWNGTEIQPKMSEVQISKKREGIAWGALYWQYFEDLDKITSAETPLKLNKKLFLKKNTDTGEVISEITEKSNLQVGDLVKVRIELRANRPMEFVHMKDMRAAGFEPINVISRYKWQDGLGYYEATKDASTNFFFDYVPKGVFVFEYDVRVNNAGEFSNGITTIQSMYAPEFSSHSEGKRILVESE